MLNKALRAINGIPIFCTVTLIIALNFLPAAYASYIRGPILAGCVGLLAGPFLLNAFFMRRMLFLNSMKTYFLLGALLFLAGLDLFFMWFLYADQWSSSRGFAVIVCLSLFIKLFLPVWVLSLFLLLRRDRVQ